MQNLLNSSPAGALIICHPPERLIKPIRTKQKYVTNTCIPKLLKKKILINIKKNFVKYKNDKNDKYRHLSESQTEGKKTH